MSKRSKLMVQFNGSNILWAPSSLGTMTTWAWWPKLKIAALQWKNCFQCHFWRAKRWDGDGFESYLKGLQVVIQLFLATHSDPSTHDVAGGRAKWWAWVWKPCCAGAARQWRGKGLPWDLGKNIGKGCFHAPQNTRYRFGPCGSKPFKI